MENSGTSSFLRTSRLESCFNASSSLSVKETPKRSVKEELRSKRRADIYLDEEGWGSVLISWIRIVMCFLTMMVTTFVWASIMLLLIPWPYERIRQGNIYGHVTGRLMMWILGNPIKIEGAEFSNKRAIYISNHASPLDIFLIMWLTPTGTVGIAKKERVIHIAIVPRPVLITHWNDLWNSSNLILTLWYPLFGQLYVLANHLRIDRSNPTAAIESMKEAARAVVKNNLSLIIFPEGTRSKNGRLLKFKKGFVHLALQSRLPIVPMVLTGTHLAWRKGSLHIRPAPLNVNYLPPISTTDWTADKIEDYIKMIHDLYATHLPESQRPS